MGERSGIEWTENTFNPWWGCERVSEACRFCYAETWAKRTGHDVWGANTERRMFGDKHWNDPLKWDRQARERGRPMLVFCASMADVFEDHPALDDDRDRLFELIEATPNLRWQLLTKRPENIIDMVPVSWRDGFPPNVWQGASTETQARLEERMPYLAAVPAAVRFLSVEPLLGPIEITPPTATAVDWVIVGGESGTNRQVRPMHPGWAADLRDACASYSIPFFFKQWGEWRPNTVHDSLARGVWLDRQGHRYDLDADNPHPESILMRRVGKKHAGRELDHRTYSELPPLGDIVIPDQQLTIGGTP